VVCAAEVQAALGAWPCRVESVAPLTPIPGADGFLLGGDGDGEGALIDWATTLRGPLLYDLACFAVMTSPAGPHAARWFTEGYAAQMPEISPQLVHVDCC
jgi:hypothetical protein